MRRWQRFLAGVGRTFSFGLLRTRRTPLPHDLLEQLARAFADLDRATTTTSGREDASA